MGNDFQEEENTSDQSYYAERLSDVKMVIKRNSQEEPKEPAVTQRVATKAEKKKIDYDGKLSEEQKEKISEQVGNEKTISDTEKPPTKNRRVSERLRNASISSISSAKTETSQLSVKRGRGRPRKNEARSPKTSTPKKKTGRSPRKTDCVKVVVPKEEKKRIKVDEKQSDEKVIEFLNKYTYENFPQVVAERINIPVPSTSGQQKKEMMPPVIKTEPKGEEMQMPRIVSTFSLTRDPKTLAEYQALLVQTDIEYKSLQQRIRRLAAVCREKDEAHLRLVDEAKGLQAVADLMIEDSHNWEIKYNLLTVQYQAIKDALVHLRRLIETDTSNLEELKNKVTRSIEQLIATGVQSDWMERAKEAYGRERELEEIGKLGESMINNVPLLAGGVACVSRNLIDDISEAQLEKEQREMEVEKKIHEPYSPKPINQTSPIKKAPKEKDTAQYKTASSQVPPPAPYYKPTTRKVIPVNRNRTSPGKHQRRVPSPPRRKSYHHHDEWRREKTEGEKFRAEVGRRTKKNIEDEVHDTYKNKKVNIIFEKYPFLAVKVDDRLRRLYMNRRIVGGGLWGSIAEMGTYYGTMTEYDPLSKASHGEKEVMEKLKGMEEIEETVVASFGHNELAKLALEMSEKELVMRMSEILENIASLIELLWQKGMKDLKVIQLPSRTGSPAYDYKADALNAAISKIIDATSPSNSQVTYWDLFGQLADAADNEPVRGDPETARRRNEKYIIDYDKKLIKIEPSFAAYVVQDLARCFHSRKETAIIRKMRQEKREFEKEIEK